jgi:hypothetical protein
MNAKTDYISFKIPRRPLQAIIDKLYDTDISSDAPKGAHATADLDVEDKN